MVNLQYVKNDSYEKGTDLMVVNVYLKGICRDTARVIFREQDFTLIFQTRLWPLISTNKACGFLLASLERAASDWPSFGFPLQWCQLSAASFRLWTEHSLQVASQTQVLLELACSCLETRILKWAGEERNTGMFFCVDVWANCTELFQESRLASSVSN